jgi:hypothetical protein
MNSLGLDTIAGAKLLQLRFGSAGVFQPEQAVIHCDRRARFIRVSDGAAIIRYWGDSRAVTVPLEALSLPAVSEELGAKPRHAVLGGPSADRSERRLGRRHRWPIRAVLIR